MSVDFLNEREEFEGLSGNVDFFSDIQKMIDEFELKIKEHGQRYGVALKTKVFLIIERKGD